MASPTLPAPVSQKVIWIGRVLSALPVLLMLFSAAMKFSNSPELAKGFGHLGWPVSLAAALGILEIACIVVYLIPRTAVLGAILVTGYLGGAIATHVRVGDPVYMHVVLGVLVWGGLYLRDARLPALIPLAR